MSGGETPVLVQDGAQNLVGGQGVRRADFKHRKQDFVGRNGAARIQQVFIDQFFHCVAGLPLHIFFIIMWLRASQGVSKPENDTLWIGPSALSVTSDSIPELRSGLVCRRAFGPSYFINAHYSTKRKR